MKMNLSVGLTLHEWSRLILTQRQKETAKLLVQSFKNVESAHMPRIIIVKLFQVQTKLFLITFQA